VRATNADFILFVILIVDNNKNLTISLRMVLGIIPSTLRAQSAYTGTRNVFSQLKRRSRFNSIDCDASSSPRRWRYCGEYNRFEKLRTANTLACFEITIFLFRAEHTAAEAASHTDTTAGEIRYDPDRW